MPFVLDIEPFQIRRLRENPSKYFNVVLKGLKYHYCTRDLDKLWYLWGEKKSCDSCGELDEVQSIYLENLSIYFSGRGNSVDALDQDYEALLMEPKIVEHHPRSPDTFFIFSQVVWEDYSQTSIQLAKSVVKATDRSVILFVLYLKDNHEPEYCFLRIDSQFSKVSFIQQLRLFCFYESDFAFPDAKKTEKKDFSLRNKIFFYILKKFYSKAPAPIERQFLSRIKHYKWYISGHGAAGVAEISRYDEAPRNASQLINDILPKIYLSSGCAFKIRLSSCEGGLGDEGQQSFAQKLVFLMMKIFPDFNLSLQIDAATALLIAATLQFPYLVRLEKSYPEFIEKIKLYIVNYQKPFVFQGSNVKQRTHLLSQKKTWGQNSDCPFCNNPIYFYQKEHHCRICGKRFHESCIALCDVSHLRRQYTERFEGKNLIYREELISRKKTDIGARIVFQSHPEKPEDYKDNLKFICSKCKSSFS